MTPTHVAKPWGHEVIWAHVPGHYVGKFLHVNPGQRLSTQYHERKHETMTLVSGDATVYIKTDEGVFRNNPLSYGPVDIPPGTVHWIGTTGGCVICEVSTDDLDDVVRIYDPYKKQR